MWPAEQLDVGGVMAEGRDHRVLQLVADVLDIADDEIQAFQLGLQSFRSHQVRLDWLAVPPDLVDAAVGRAGQQEIGHHQLRSEEHTSELQSLMRLSYAVFC